MAVTHFRDESNTRDIDIDWLEDELAYRASGRMIHFSSCSAVSIDALRIKRFMGNTGLKAVSGYRGEVAWVDSATFELAVLDRLTDRRRGFTKASFKAMERDVVQTTGRLAEDLGYGIFIA